MDKDCQEHTGVFMPANKKGLVCMTTVPKHVLHVDNRA